MAVHTSHRLKNLTIFALSLLLSFLLSRHEPFRQFLSELGAYGYIGAFFAGMLFVCSFTVPVGALALAILARTLSPFPLALAAGLGGVIGDMTILHLVRDDLAEDLEPIYRKFGGNHLVKLLHTKYFRWTLPVIGAIIIISPLPDELGVSLLDISGMSTVELLLISFMLNTGSMFFVTLAASSGKI